MGRHPDYDILAIGKGYWTPDFLSGSCGYVSLDLNNHDDVKHLFMDFLARRNNKLRGT